jgi:hypothetical protein
VSAWPDEWGGAEREPWARDPDAWRGDDAGRLDSGDVPDAPVGPWPQLDATPLYWMWCQRFERERGIDQ